MKKRIMGSILALIMLIGCIPIMASAKTNIQIGEYVQMGTYYGEPILWRCVDMDENGYLMLSDKILCIKAFDATGEENMKTGSHAENSERLYCGSNYWGDSNMRSWLNSTSRAGNVNWLCGNPPIAERIPSGYNSYDKEAGFLSNFTYREQNAMKQVSQKSLLSSSEISAGMATIGTEPHTYNSNIDSVVQNYDTAYAEYVTDKIFLLDVKQANAVYNNSNILGKDYYIGEPTARCAANSEYKSEDLETNKKWHSWLRSVDSHSDSVVRCIFWSGEVESMLTSYGHLGVRPAFYFADTTNFTSGNGTESKPYTISDNGNTPSNTPKPSPTAKPTPKPTSAPKYFTVLGSSVTNKADTVQTAAIIIAEYNGGKLTNVTTEKITFAANETKAFTIPQGGKIFVWDSLSGMQPLVK